jgi:hypothetical protein
MSRIAQPWPTMVVLMSSQDGDSPTSTMVAMTISRPRTPLSRRKVAAADDEPKMVAG